MSLSIDRPGIASKPFLNGLAGLWLHRPVVLVALLLAVSTAVFWPGLRGGFLFDDYPNIVNSQAVHMERFDLESLQKAAGAYKALPGRPIATVSFALDYYFHGKDPRGYKATSLAVHLLNAVLVFWLVCALMRLVGAARTQAQATAFAVTLAWAVHPIQMSTVLYVVQRMEMLSLTFVLLALLSYLAGRQRQIEGVRAWPWIVATIPLGVLALLAKESALLLPLYALALEATVLRFQASDPSTSRRWRWAYGSGIALVVAVFLAALPSHVDPVKYALREFTLGERLLTQLRILPMHLGQMLLPLPNALPFYYDDMKVSRSLLDPATTLLGGLLLAALAALAAGCRKRLPLVSLGIMWFFCAHALTSNIIPLELAFEHRNYFALLGIVLALAGLLRAVPAPSGASVKSMIIVCILGTLAALGAIRAATWGNPLLLATQMTALNPGSARASVDLASRYAGLSDNDAASPMYAMAIAEFERGARLPSASPLSEQGMILLAAMAGRPQKAAWWDSLNDKLRRRPIGAQERSAVTSLMMRRYEGIAIDDRQLSRTYALFVKRSGNPPDLYVQYADFVYTYLKDEPLAQRLYVRAVELARHNPLFGPALLSQLIAQGRTGEATAVLARMRELDSAPVGH